jgi:hypothetical protein
MIVNVGGPKSEIEAEATKKFITEKEIKSILAGESNQKILRQTKSRIRELLDFYDRIIRSIDVTIKTVKSSTQLSHQQKNDKYLNQQEKELSRAKSEKAKFRRYLHTITTSLIEN